MRERIVLVARELFMTEGVEAVSMPKIAREVGCSANVRGETRRDQSIDRSQLLGGLGVGKARANPDWKTEVIRSGCV